MNKKGLIPRMALQSIRKNSSTYLPYIGVCVFAMFTYFVFDLILNNDVTKTIPKAGYAIMLMQIGFGLLGIIMVPFLYYTNSFLIKRRKKELGLYSILGMEKKHIGMMMFVETGIIYAVVEVVAMGLGLLFSKLLFLLLLNLAKLPVQADFSVSGKAISDTLVFFGMISLINLTANLYQVGKANPIDLMSESKKGEKEPKCVWLWSVIGILALGTGYRIAMQAQLNSMIFTDFFLAVFLVVVGTHFLFTSGSIALLRFLKCRKKFYYRAENFVMVSGMLYRMKKSAASLVNICIFGTMVIITAICTVSLYLGIPGIVKFLYPFDMEVNFMDVQFADKEEWFSDITRLAEENQVTLDEQHYSYLSCPVERGGRSFVPRTGNTRYENMDTLNLITLSEFNRLEQTQYTLEEGEVLLFSSGADFGDLTDADGNAGGVETVTFQDRAYVIKEELMCSRVSPKARDNTFGGEYYIIVRDEESRTQLAAFYGMDSDSSRSFKVQMTPKGEPEKVASFVSQAKQLSAAAPGYASFRYYVEHVDELVSMYGGLLFIGIFFALIFLICLLVILYYKQITEGFEDQSSFEIMQKVGMSDKEVKGTIKKQILLVFFLPLLGAFCHTAVGTNMIIKLFGALSLFNPPLVIGCAVGVSAAFAVVYVFCYQRTAKTYYRIVKWS